MAGRCCCARWTGRSICWAGCFRDGRAPQLVKHRLPEMLAQRIYGLALGYDDHEQLRSDPLLAVLSGKPELDEPLAGKSTLNRLDHSRSAREPLNQSQSMQSSGSGANGSSDS